MGVGVCGSYTSCFCLCVQKVKYVCTYIFSMNMRKGRCDLFSISDRLETQLTSEVFEKRIGYCPNLILILAIVCCSPSN